MRSKVIYPKLSYALIGIMYDTHSELGGQYQEKYYQRAVEIALKEEGLNFIREQPIDLNFKNKPIGKYYINFVVENKILLELKAKPAFTKSDFQQVKSYLKVCDLKLAILVNFRGKKLDYKRVLNLY